MSDAIREIVVPVDGSKHSVAAAAHGAALAKALGASITLAHVFPQSTRQLLEQMGGPEASGSALISGESLGLLRTRNAEQAFGGARKALTDQGITPNEEVLPGRPVTAISQYVEGRDGCQLVLGRRGAGRMGEVLLGSVSEQVLQSVRCPVTAISGAAKGQETPAVLVVPVDASDPSCRAAAFAARQARATGAEIHLLHAFPASPRDIPLLADAAVDVNTIEGLDPENWHRLSDASANEAFQAARAAMEDDGLTVVEVRREDEPAPAVTGYLKELERPGVVIGRRGLGRLRQMLMGSVSQRVVHTTDAPVTVIS